MIEQPNSNQASHITSISKDTILSEKVLGIIPSDLLIIVIILIGFVIAGTLQFTKILGLPFTPKIFVMPGVMAVIFSTVVTRLRVIKRRLKYERDQKDFAKTQIQFLNQRLNELLNQRTELLIEAQDQIVLAQTRADLGALAAGVIHDLNNALTAIKMGWEGLEFAEKEEIEECQSSITNGIHRAIVISREFSSFIRPQQDQSVDVIELSHRLVSMLRRTMGPNQRLQLSWSQLYSPLSNPTTWSPSEANQQPPSTFKLYVSLSEGQLTQILMNLIVNARDALQDKVGLVKLEVASDQNFITCKVIDNGSGISAEVQQKIFEPFFTTKKEGQGTGLGLHVLSTLVQRAQGEILLESEVGRGTTFTIRLPHHQ